ncbi:nipblb, partial [Symbiodinium pilosum]
DGIVTRDMYWDLNASFYISGAPYADVKKAVERAKSSTKRKDRSDDHIRKLVLPPWAAHDEPVHPDIAAQATGPEEKWDSKEIQHAGAWGGSCLGYERIMERRDALRNKFFKAWEKAGLDVLLCPVYPTPAPHVEE